MKNLCCILTVLILILSHQTIVAQLPSNKKIHPTTNFDVKSSIAFTANSYRIGGLHHKKIQYTDYQYGKRMSIPKSIIPKVDFLPSAFAFQSTNVFTITGQENNKIVIATIDKKGKILNKINLPDSIRGRVFAIHPTSEGGYVLAGQRIRDAMVCKVDSMGNVIWYKHFGTKGMDNIMSIELGKDGSIYLAGYSDLYDNQEILMWLVQLDFKGNIVNEKTFGEGHKNSIGYGVKVNDNNIVLTGTFDKQLVVLQLNHDFDVVQELYSTDTSKSYAGKAIEILTDSSYLLFGDVKYNTKKSPYLLTFEFPKTTTKRLNKNKRQVTVPLSQDSVIANKHEPNIITPNLHLISIGINAGEINYGEKDAIDFLNLFDGSTSKLYKEIYLHSLIGKKATATNIRIEIKKLIYKAQQTNNFTANDIIIFYFSGHGYYNGNLVGLRGEDFTPIAPELTTVSLQDIKKEFSVLPCKKLLFIDACLSDSTANEKIKTLFYPSQQDFSLFLSCSTNENSYENQKWENGAFTKILIEGMKTAADKDKDQLVSLKELENYINKILPQLVQTTFNKKQTPHFINNISKPTFIYKKP